MGECFVVSYIIRTFILSVVQSETGPRQHSLVEGRLHPALYCSKGESIRQVGVHLLLIFQSSRMRCDPQTNTQR